MLRKRHNDSWKKYWCELDGDQLSFFSNPESPIKRHSCFTVVYAHTSQITKEDELVYAQLGKGQPLCKSRIMVVTPGRIIKLSGITDDDGKKWAETFQTLLSLKYTKEELDEKEQVRKELEPLLRDQELMLEERYRIITRALKDVGFFIDDVPKEKEGYLELLKRTGKDQFARKKLYAVLYRDFLYFFKPHETPSVDAPPYDLINLRYITSLTVLDKNTFEIKTPLRTFNLQAKHDVAVEEWVNCINKFRTRKTKQYFVKEEIAALDDHGYHYSKPLEGRIILTLQSDSDGNKPKKWKPKGSVITIGRSSTNTIQLEDKYVSRNHAKIELINNVPYLIDLGSNTGTKLNRHRVLKHALKPGDVIRVGKTNIVFDVKDKETIFSQEPVSRDELSKEKKQKRLSKDPNEKIVVLEEN